MKAIFLTTGYSNRMRPLTDHKHKTFLKIGDQNLIEKIINRPRHSDTSNFFECFKEKEIKSIKSEYFFIPGYKHSSY